MNENKDILVSVIVPVYNTEKYLRQCLDSIVNQTYQNLEIIIVNDGSTDSSLAICKEYKNNDLRINIINKKNGGLSSARNAGLKEATGDYVLFVDSDDFYDDIRGINCLINDLLSYQNKKLDILNFHYKKFVETTNKNVNCFNTVNIEDFKELVNYSEQIRWLIKNSQYISSACNKLIKREFLIENEVFFEKNTLSEDIEWSLKLLIYAKSMGIVNRDFYVYRQRDNSITHSISEKHIDDLFKIIKNSLTLINKKCTGDFKNTCMNYLSFQFCTLLINIHYLSNDKKNKYYNKLEDLKFLLRYHLNKKVYYLYLINKVFGFKILYFFSYVYSKMR